MVQKSQCVNVSCGVKKQLHSLDKDDLRELRLNFSTSARTVFIVDSCSNSANNYRFYYRSVTLNLHKNYTQRKPMATTGNIKLNLTDELN